MSCPTVSLGSSSSDVFTSSTLNFSYQTFVFFSAEHYPPGTDMSAKWLSQALVNLSGSDFSPRAETEPVTQTRAALRGRPWRSARSCRLSSPLPLLMSDLWGDRRLSSFAPRFTSVLRALLIRDKGLSERREKISDLLPSRAGKAKIVSQGASCRQSRRCDALPRVFTSFCSLPLKLWWLGSSAGPAAADASLLLQEQSQLK